MWFLRTAILLLALMPVSLSAADIAKVEPDGTLIAEDGQAMRLAHLRLPAALSPSMASLQAEAVAFIEARCSEQHIAFVTLGTDRWQRPLVSVALEDGSLEGLLLRRGLAVVDGRGGIGGDLVPLYAAEDTARRQKRGLWGEGLLRVHAADERMPESGFGIVEGRVTEVAKVGGRIYVNFGADYKTDFTVLLEGDAARAFAESAPSALDLGGYRVRVRGMLEEWNGPLLRLAGPQDMEILSAVTTSSGTEP